MSCHPGPADPPTLYLWSASTGTRGSMGVTDRLGQARLRMLSAIKEMPDPMATGMVRRGYLNPHGKQPHYVYDVGTILTARWDGDRVVLNG